MIDKEVFRKTESRLYRHFKQAKLIEKLKHKIVIMWKQMEQIERDIKETNVTVETGLNMGIDYSREKIQTSPSGTGYAEQQIILEIGKLERELLYKKKKILKLNARIRELEEQTQDMQYNLSTLSEEAKIFVEWKYGEEKSVEWIANEMYGGARATAYRKREELVENIAQWCNFTK
jgi:uncharacterized coiled-coil protein SlyX